MRSLNITLCAALLSISLLKPAKAAPTLTNGGFETPVLPAASFLNITPGSEPLGFGWQVITNNVDVISQGVLGSTGPVVEGLQALDLVGFGATGAIQQSFATTLGTTYALSFYYGNNPVSTGSASADVTITSGANTLLARSVSHSSSTSSDFNWTFFSATFTATGSSATLLFNNTVGGANGGVFLDSVAIDPAPVGNVPEPASCALLGIGLIACALRKNGAIFS